MKIKIDAFLIGGLVNYILFIPAGIYFSNMMSLFTGIFFGTLFIITGKISNYTKNQELLRHKKQPLLKLDITERAVDKKPRDKRKTKNDLTGMIGVE